MSEFQTIATVIMLSILASVMLPKIFKGKTADEHLTPEERAMLNPKVSDAEFKQTMPFDIAIAITSNQKLEAVKLYRQQFGCSLREAKNAVERYIKQHR